MQFVGAWKQINPDGEDYSQERYKEETEIEACVYYNFIDEASRHNKKHVIWKN